MKPSRDNRLKYVVDVNFKYVRTSLNEHIVLQETNNRKNRYFWFHMEGKQPKICWTANFINKRTQSNRSTITN